VFSWILFTLAGDNRPKIVTPRRTDYVPSEPNQYVRLYDFPSLIADNSRQALRIAYISFTPNPARLLLPSKEEHDYPYKPDK
jgi:hypothetical protein